MRKIAQLPARHERANEPSPQDEPSGSTRSNSGQQMGRRKHRVKAFDEMSDGRIGELLWAFREHGPSGPITIRRGEMISGRLRQAERAQTGVGHKSEFIDDRAGTPRFWQPEESRPAGPCPPTAVPVVRFPGQTLPITPRRPLNRSSGNKLKSWSGRFQLA